MPLSVSNVTHSSIETHLDSATKDPFLTASSIGRWTSAKNAKKVFYCLRLRERKLSVLRNQSCSVNSLSRVSWNSRFCNVKSAAKIIS